MICTIAKPFCICSITSKIFDVVVIVVLFSRKAFASLWGQAVFIGQRSDVEIEFQEQTKRDS